MRNPNGYGSVVKLSGSRRRPYAVRKTRGWNDNGHPIYEVIGYFPTRNDAMIALAEYNKSPWDVNEGKITLAALFNLWLEKKAPKLGASTVSALKTAFNKHTRRLHGLRYKEIKAYHMQEAVDAAGGYSVQNQVRGLFYHLDRFALELDVSARQYSTLVTTAPAPEETTRAPFTAEEIARLWDNAAAPWVDTALIYLYSGWRVSELLNLRRIDIDFAAGTMRGGVKTASGKGRVVPVHSRILPLIENRYASSGDFLITNGGRRLSKELYYPFWRGVMNGIEAAHVVHEARHTFRSRLDSAGANKVCIDLLMGHKSGDVGERVYTHKTIEELKTAIELVTY